MSPHTETIQPPAETEFDAELDMDELLPDADEPEVDEEAKEAEEAEIQDFADAEVEKLKDTQKFKVLARKVGNVAITSMGLVSKTAGAVNRARLWTKTGALIALDSADGHFSNFAEKVAPKLEDYAYRKGGETKARQASRSIIRASSRILQTYVDERDEVSEGFLDEARESVRKIDKSKDHGNRVSRWAKNWKKQYGDDKQLVQKAALERGEELYEQKQSNLKQAEIEQAWQEQREFIHNAADVEEKGIAQFVRNSEPDYNAGIGELIPAEKSDENPDDMDPAHYQGFALTAIQTAKMFDRYPTAHGQITLISEDMTQRRRQQVEEATGSLEKVASIEDEHNTAVATLLWQAGFLEKLNNWAPPKVPGAAPRHMWDAEPDTNEAGNHEFKLTTSAQRSEYDGPGHETRTVLRIPFDKNNPIHAAILNNNLPDNVNNAFIQLETVGKPYSKYDINGPQPVPNVRISAVKYNRDFPESAPPPPKTTDTAGNPVALG